MELNGIGDQLCWTSDILESIYAGTLYSVGTQDHGRISKDLLF